MENYKYIYKHRRGTADQWKNSEIIPEEAELIVELDEENYKHKLKLGDGIHTYEDLSYLTVGGETVTQTLARTVSVTLYASAWEEVTCESDPNIGYYKQTLNIDGIVSNSKVDLQPTADMIAIFQSKNLAFVTETVIENDVPTIICYSIGSTPSSDYTLQATVTEVEVDGNNIIGNTVSTIPNLDDYAAKSFVEDKVEELEPLITTTSRHLPSGIATALSEGRRVVVTDNGTSFGKLVFDNFVYFEEDNVVTAYTFSNSGVDACIHRIYGYISSNEWGIVRSPYPTKTGDLYNDVGYITEIQLESSVETALTQAKESGEFDGTSVTIASISESTEDDGNNIVTFSDGNTLTVQNGSQGVSGVYVGPGDMPNGYNVQIDPDGDLTDISGVYVGSGEMPEGYNVQIDPDGDVIDEADLKGADGYTPQKGVDYWTEEDKAEMTAQVQAVCVAKNQGSANVGKILVVGADGNLTLADMPEGGASGDVVGMLDESNNILLSGNLADGTYTLKYENTDGTYTDIGTLEVGAIPEPIEPVTENITLTDGIRVGSDGTDRTQAGCCATPMIDLTNIPKPCTINLTKALWCNGTESSSYTRVYATKADGTQIISRTTEEGMAEDYFNVVCNNGNQGDVTVTVLSDEVGYIRFSASWTASAGGADSTTSFAEAGTKATLTYTPNA